MKTAFILHGTVDGHEYFEMDFPSPSNSHWYPWLQQKLLRGGILCQTLEMPAPYDPVYSEWKNIFDKFNNSDLSVIVGHSSGAGFALKWIHENPNIYLDKLALVAPDIFTDESTDSSFKFELKKGALDKVKSIRLFYSSDDRSESVQQSVEQIMTMYPNIICHNYTNMGHFTFRHTGPIFEDLWTALK